ncbi:MAG: TldD/PmbA family protein [Candidatus Thorarchaeota archaeon]|jgi:PmbA protein
MIEEEVLLDLCEYIVKSGKEKGADHIEVLAGSESEVESDIEMGQISQVSKKNLSEIAIRLYIGKRMGSAFTNIPTRDAANEALDLAISAAKATTEDEDWTAFPLPTNDYPVVEGLWQESVLNSDSGEVVGIAGKALGLATKAEPGLIPGFGGSAAIGYSAAYANSNGIAHSDKGTVAYVVLGGISQTESGMTPMVFSYDIKRDMNVDVESTVDDVASTIRICKNPADGTTGKHTIIMHPFAYGQVMQFTLIQSIRGDNVSRGKSKIGDKLGEKIASSKVTIVDDGLHPRGVSSSTADDEGVPRQRTPIIEKGVLRSFLWDTYWANKMGVKSTGNAKRNMRQGLVNISPSNIVVESGEREIEDIIKGIEHGYYIRGVQGAHSSNPESGDFSIVGNPAILIKNGKMVGAVHGLMVAGNVYDLLNQVDEVAKTPLYLQGVIGPEIVFKDVSLIAKE